MLGYRRWSDDVHYFTLQPSEIDQHWSWIEPLLKTIDEAVWTTAEVRDALKSSEAQLWAFGDDPRGIVVTRLGKIGNTPSGLIWLAAGKSVEAFTHFLRAYIEPWFQSRGCRVVEIVGRRGWKKFLPDYRELPQTTFAKELLDE